MCWRGADSRGMRLALAVLPLGVGSACATPRGVLFPLPERPIVWPSAPEPPRIAFVGALRDSDDLRAGRSAWEGFLSVVRGARPAIGFTGPQSVAVRLPAVLAVADGAGASVHIIDLDARTHRLVTGACGEALAVPFGVAWVDDELFVSDARRRELIVLAADGSCLRRLACDELERPAGLAYATRVDRLFVVDSGAHCLRTYTRDGRLERTIGERGAQPGQFNFPTHVCARDEQLLVADSGNFRVQRFDDEGNFLGSFGQKGDGAGDFALPKGVAMDSRGRIYVVDAQFENVQVFDVSGALLLAFGREGREAGEFWLPAGIVIDRRDRIFVADTGNRRIQVFQFLGAGA